MMIPRSCASVVAASILLAALPAEAQKREVPEGFEQIIPRGRIAAIDGPQYVPAAEARMRDDAWVLGVVIGGQARAYSLDLLNAHEVVNDTLGDINFAAVW